MSPAFLLSAISNQQNALVLGVHSLAVPLHSVALLIADC
jgi:hypothetical protein